MMANRAIDAHLILVAAGVDELSFYQTHLTQTDIQLIHTSEGKRCLSLFEAEQPDLVILSADLWDMDGYDVCRRLRSLDHLAQTPILMTVPDDPDAVKQALAAGCTDCIRQPILPELLHRRVVNLMSVSSPKPTKQNGHKQHWHQQMFEQMNAIQLLLEPDSLMILDASPSACQFFDLTMTDLREQRIVDLLPETSLEEKTHALRSTDQTTTLFEAAYNPPHGGTRSLEVSISFIEVESKRYLLATLFDTTARDHQIPISKIYDTVPVMLCSLDENGIILTSNKELLKELGYSEGDLVGRHITYIIEDRGHEFIQANILTPLFEQGTLYDTYCTCTRKDGNSLELQLNGMLVTDISGFQSGLLTLRDITKRRQIEESLRLSESEMQTIFAAMTESVVVLDSEGRYVKIPNTRSQHPFISRMELLGRRVHELYPKEQADHFLHCIQTSLETNGPVETEYILEGYGKQIWYSAIATPLGEADRVVWVAHDITERKAAEAALRVSEQQYRALFEYANDAVLVFDMRTGRVLDCNQRTTTLLGYTHEEMLALTIHDIEYTAEKNTPESITTKLITSRALIYEQVFQRKDGSTVDVETSNRIIRSDEDRWILCLARDIAERKANQETENQQRILAEALRDTAAAINSTLELEEVLELILANVSRVVESTTVNIMLIEGDYASPIRGLKYPNIDEITAIRLNIHKTDNLRWMIEHKKPYLMADVQSDPSWIYVPAVQWIRASLGAPIIIDDAVIGFLNLDSDKPGEFTSEHAERLQAFAEQAAIAIRNARMYKEIQRHADELEHHVTLRTAALNEVNQNLKRTIIERQRAEQNLQEERNLLQTILDTMPDVVYVKNTAHEFIMVNRESMRVFQRPLEEIIGKTDVDFIEDKQKLSQIVSNEKQLMSGEVDFVRYEDEIPDITRGRRWLDIIKVPLRDVAGRIIGLVGVNHDITDIKHAERQLQQILESARSLLWFGRVHEEDGDFEWSIHVANEEAANTFLPLEPDETQTYSEAWLASRSSEDLPRLYATSSYALRNNLTSYNNEYRCIVADGRVRWLTEDVIITPLMAGHWSVVGICTDITERKLAEKQLRQTNDELERRVEIRTAELIEANKALKQEISDRILAQQEEKQRSHELEMLRQANLELNAMLDLGSMLKLIAGYALKLTNADMAYIFLYNNDTLSFGASMAEGKYLDQPKEPPRKDGLTMNVARTGRPIVVEDIQQNETYRSPGWYGAIVGLPLKTQDQVVGVLNIIYKKPHQFDQNELRILNLLADQTALSIRTGQYIVRIEREITERKRAEAAQRDQRILAEALRDAAEEFSRTLELDEVLNSILAHIVRVVPSHELSSVMLIGEDKQIHAHYRRRHQNNTWINSFSDARIPVSHFPHLQRMLQTYMTIVVYDAKDHTDWAAHTETVSEFRSYVGTPIQIESKIIGFVMLSSTQPQAFTEEHARRLQAFANQASVAIQNARLLEEIRVHAAELEQRVIERTAELEYERAQLHAILNAMRDGVIYRDDDGVIHYVNDALIDMTGYQTEDWLDRRAEEEISILSTEEVAALWQRIYRQLDKYGFWQGEAKLKHRNGQTFDASLTRTGVFNTQGERRGTVTVVRDISQAKKLDEQKARFIANASHELRTPITNVKTRLYLIRKQPEKMEQHLEVISEVINWMQQLIQNLFDISRFERGVISLERDDVSFTALVKQMVKVFEEEAAKKQIILSYQGTDSPAMVYGDKDRLLQVISNLINNAINYTPEEGHVDVTLTIQTHTQGQMAVLEVCDNGVGISEENQQLLFQPFFRGQEDNKGAGLGLSIAREIIELHGGEIDVSSIEGNGSCFTIRLALSATESE